MAIKSVKLKSPAARAVLLGAAFLCVVAVYFAVKWCLASTLATQTPIKEVAEFAVGLAPNDPKTHYSLAALSERTFLTDDFAKSVEEYERAASLSPNDFRLWFDLARARDRHGDAKGAEKAFRKAVELAPNYSRIHWAFGNLLLRQGNTDEAFVEIRRAVENDPSYANPAVSVAWQFFDADVPLISQKIGDSIPIKSALSTFLAGQKRFDEAFALWNALSAEDKKVTYKTDSEQLLTVLLGAKKYREALTVQSQIIQPEGEKFEVGKIFNGGFEADVKTTNPTFFEWTIADGVQPQIGYDEAQKHGGKRSLVVFFNSQTGQEFRAIQQNVAVEGGKRYTFETFFRADLKNNNPSTVRWEILDVADGKPLASTSPVTATSDWAPLAAEFTTPPATEAVTIRFARVTCPISFCPISGKVWFDDFNLKKSE